MFKFMRDYVEPYWKHIILAMIVIVLQVYFQINVLQETKRLIDIGIYQNNLSFINNTGIYMMILIILYGFTILASSYLSSYISASVTCDVRESLFEKAISLSSYDFNKFGVSTLMTRATADTTRIQIFMINFLRNALLIPIVIIGVTIAAAEINRNDLRDAFGMVLQNSWVFKGTVAENIAYGKRDATMGEIVEVSKLIGCDSFINLLPEGYETIISEEDSQLSVGEKQLLVLARTVLSNPKILILDEATSNMDTRTEHMVTSAMNHMMEGKTTFIIAHRLFTIINADKIIFMKDGDIKEVGSHEELLKLDGLYAEMFRKASS